MRLKRFISSIAAVSMLAGLFAAGARADGLFSGAYTEKDFTVSETDGVRLEIDVPDGDYTVNVKTGGDTETKANIYINGGERVRAYTLEAGKSQDNVQPVVPKDGKIDFQIIGENPNVTEITVEQLAEREKADKPTIYIAGDSTAQTYNYETAYPQTGWGQVFDRFFTDEVKIDNRSMAGRSSKSYNNDGRLDAILTEMHPGDFVFIQFGINDGAENKPERYISVEDYKKLITDKYIGEVEKRGGIPVLMTASAAAWWDEENGGFMESRADYADPTRELAKELGCRFIDINEVMTAVWNGMDKDEVLSGYFICEPLESKAYPTGTNDTTHMKEKGASVVAGLIADMIPDCVPELANYLKGEEVFTDISGHWAEDAVKELAKENIVRGDGTGKFNPEDSVTRAEFLKMAMDACGIVGHAYREGECPGAKQEDWFCYYVQGALDKGLIPAAMMEGADVTTEIVNKTLAEATEDSEAVTAEITKYTLTPTNEPPFVTEDQAFGGNKNIKREEMAALMMNCMSYKLKNSDSGDMSGSNYGEAFTDAADIDPAYANAVDAAYANGYIKGMGDGTFAPKAELTRAEAAVVVSGMLEASK